MEFEDKCISRVIWVIGTSCDNRMILQRALNWCYGRILELAIYCGSFQVLYTILLPYLSPFFKTTMCRQSDLLIALTKRLGSMQKPENGPRLGLPSTAASSWSGLSRVSNGILATSRSITKTSSKASLFGPIVKGSVTLLGCGSMLPNGMPVLSSGRYCWVKSLAEVPSTVSPPLRLK